MAGWSGLAVSELESLLTGFQGTLILYAVVLFAFFFNTVLARLLPLADWTILAIHILGWFAILISMVVVGPHHSNEEVWATFSNLGGYESSGVSFFVGLIGPVFAFMGAVRSFKHSTLGLVLTNPRTERRICLKKPRSLEPPFPGR